MTTVNGKQNQNLSSGVDKNFRFTRAAFFCSPITEYPKCLIPLANSSFVCIPFISNDTFTADGVHFHLFHSFPFKIFMNGESTISRRSFHPLSIALFPWCKVTDLKEALSGKRHCFQQCAVKFALWR